MPRLNDSGRNRGGVTLHAPNIEIQHAVCSWLYLAEDSSTVYCRDVYILVNAIMWNCSRAGGNGTACTWPYRFLRKKNGVASILTSCVIEYPLQALRRSMGRLRGPKSSSIQSSDERIEASQFSTAIT